MFDVRRDRDAPGSERAENRRVVNKVAENGEWAGVGVLEGQRDGVANAETHAEVSCAENLHRRSGLYTKNFAM
jgi:hypothetical protein